MTFQFLCPQGHLLQGEEAHMGMQCQCPQCGMAFIIPTVERPAAPASDDLLTTPSQAMQIDLDLLADPNERRDTAGEAAGIVEEGTAGLELENLDVSELDRAAADDSMLHIPCPNGHELETPPDMIGQRVMCPHCQVEFRLRREKSVEYIRRQEMLDQKRAQFWFRLAILAAALVGFALLIMFAVMTLS
jgi:hypothetical protein